MQLVTRLLSFSIVKFGLTGVLNTAVGLGCTYAFMWFFKASVSAANLLGYLVGFCVSYYVNSRWTFSYREALHAKLLPYALVIVVAYFVNLICVHFCINVLHMNKYLAQAMGVPPYTLLTYFCVRRFVFRSN